MRLVSAGRFAFQGLVDAYNRTRVDYLVPMPMDAAGLRRYVRSYDVDLDESVVALDGGRIVGLGMLGVRPGRTWITRLGVLPARRGRGVGRRLMEGLIARSRRLGASRVTLEVIKGNRPAHQLFRRLGFREVRELLVIRRPPGPPATEVPPYDLQVLDASRALELLGRRRSVPSWLDERPSFVNVALNAGGLAALRVAPKGGGRGWLVYQETDRRLARLVLQPEAGRPHRVGRALLHVLHARHPALETESENLPLGDPHWPALREMGYCESFHRLEMRLELR